MVCRNGRVNDAVSDLIMSKFVSSRPVVLSRKKCAATSELLPVESPVGNVAPRVLVTSKRFEQKGTSDHGGCFQDVQYLRLDAIYPFSYHPLDTFEVSKVTQRAY